MRKSAMVEDETKGALNVLKEQLNLKNDNDIILFLLSVYQYSDYIPKRAVELLADLQKK